MPEEACLTLVLAIKYDMVASLASDQHECNDEPIRLLKELSALTNGVVLMDPTSESLGGCHSLINRLVCLSETLGQKEESLPAQSKGEDFVRYTRRVLRNAVGFESETSDEPPADSDKSARFSIATFLSFAFKENILLRNFKKTRLISVRKEQLLTIANVVAEQGGVLQQAALTDDYDSNLMGVYLKEFSKSFQFLEWLSKSAFQEIEDASHALVALVHILSAVSLAPSSTVGPPEIFRKRTDSPPPSQSNTVLHSQARKLLSKATDILISALDQIRTEEQRLMLSALLVCAVMYSSEISEADSVIVSTATKNKVLASSQEAVQLFVGESTINDETRDCIRICLTRTLSRFQDMVNLEGDTLAAAQAAVLVARLHEGGGNGDEKWYWATAFNLLREAGLNSLAKDLIDQNDSQNQLFVVSNDIQMNDLIPLELVATQLRMEANSLEVDVFRAAAKEIQDLFHKCDGILGRPEMEPFTKVVLRWICSSCVVALAEGYESWGSPNRALEYRRLGVNLCRESISSLRKLRNYSNLAYNRDPSSAWADIALSTFLLRFTERRTTSQKRISTLCARLGDHRRSEAYAVGATKEWLLGDHNVSKQRLKIKELTSIDRRELHAICQSSSYRLLLEMKAKASASDRVLESLLGSIAFDGILTPTKISNAANRVAWQIENIQNLINGKSVPVLRVKRFQEAIHLTNSCYLIATQVEICIISQQMIPTDDSTSFT